MEEKKQQYFYFKIIDKQNDVILIIGWTNRNVAEKKQQYTNTVDCDSIAFTFYGVFPWSIFKQNCIIELAPLYSVNYNSLKLCSVLLCTNHKRRGGGGGGRKKMKLR